MGIYLLHVRLKTAIGNAPEQCANISRELGHSYPFSDEGDCLHYIVPWLQGAAHLLHRLAEPLNQSLVEDYCAVQLLSLDGGYEDEPDAEEDEFGNLYREETLSEWWHALPQGPYFTRRFRRRGLLLITEGQRREGSKHLEYIKAMLGPDAARHWFGRASIFHTFWEAGYGVSLQDGRLARATEHGEIADALLFDLGRDFAAKDDELSTVATWFKREPDEPIQTAKKASPPRDPNFGTAVKGPLRPFEIARGKLSPRRMRDAS